MNTKITNEHYSYTKLIPTTTIPIIMPFIAQEVKCLRVHHMMYIVTVYYVHYY